MKIKLNLGFRVFFQLLISFTTAFLFFFISISSNFHYAGEIVFEREIIDVETSGRTEIADLDGNGFKDILIHTWATDNGLNNDGSIAWYKYPNWEKHIIKSNSNFFGDAILSRDIDGDGNLDVITSKGNYSTAEVWWYKNPGAPATSGWIEYQIGTVNDQSEVKDIYITDLDFDNDKDLVVRTKNKVALFFNTGNENWTKREINIKEREGMTVADINADNLPDIILNGFWLKHPGDPLNGSWIEYTIDEQWYSDSTGGWQDFSVMTASGDFNSDGKIDIVFSQSEKTGYHVTLYKNVDPLLGSSGWEKIEIELVDYCHTLQSADIDLDGDLDLIAGTLKRTSNPKLIALLNEGGGSFWTSALIDARSSYKAKAADVNNDGYIDITSSTSWEDPPLQIWFNNSESNLSLTSWQKYLIDPGFDYNAVALEFADINGDNLTDIITGGWWFQNPGSVSGSWVKNIIGTPLNNAVIAEDFDGDGDTDLFGSQNSGTGINNSLAWAENTSSGNFTIRTNITNAGSGDFLQGETFGNFGNGNEIFLSWHNDGGGIQNVELPAPLTNQWSSSIATTTTQKEALSKGDIDGDGDIDLLLGTIWLENQSGSWVEHTIGTVTDLNPLAEPDRNKLVDINNDGRLDALIGLENGTEIIWFEAPEDPMQLWTRNIISNVDGEGFSLDAADFDEDGDLDVIVGEHRGSITNSVILFENLAFGAGWNQIIIDTDSKNVIDHHAGTQAIDIDLDGDLDIVSIGWYNKKLWIYENRAISESAPAITAHPSNAGVIEGQSATFSVSALGTQPLTYQWYRNGQIISGANSSSYTIDYTLFSSNRDKFSCSITNTFGSVQSNSAELFVTKPDARVIESQIAFYNFEENGGSSVLDRSGVAEPLDLLITDTNSVQWNEKSLSVVNPTKIISQSAAAKIIDSIKAKNELTVEMWIKSADISQNGPARIVTLSANAVERNFTIGQGVPNSSSDQIDFRMRTTFTTTNGIPSTSSGSGTFIDSLKQITVTFNKFGYSKIFIDGELVSTQNIGGEVSNWADNYELGIANEILDERQWYGTFYLLSIYDRALSTDEINHNFQMGLTDSIDNELEWKSELSLSDAGGLDAGNFLIFGQHNNATDSLDQILGERQLPQVPEVGNFDARFELPSGSGTLIDFRDTADTFSNYILKFQPGTAGYPIFLNWDFSSIPEGSLFIKDNIDGSFVNLNMKDQNSLQINDPQIDELIIEYRETSTLSINYDDSWNLISVPLLADDMSFTTLFPSSGSAFEFNPGEGYLPADSANNGKGYWINLFGNQVVQFEGISISESVQVDSGWNIIGPFSEPIGVSQISTSPLSIISSNFFGYSSGYISAVTLEAGRAYWLKVSANGTINFSQNFQNKNNEFPLIKPLAKLIVEDNSGNSSELIVVDENIQLNRFELPPKPPAGIFDLRFNTGNQAVHSNSGETTFSVTNAEYPIKIKSEGITFTIKDLSGFELINEFLSDGEELIINNSNLKSFLLKFETATKIPTEFALYQNYPNPFNPETIIKYQVPKSGKVELKIYNVLGKEITTLENEIKEPGTYTVIFNGKNLSSGVYFFTINAGEYSESKKMLFLK